MARCTICFHSKLNQMDHALLQGEQLKRVAKRFHVSVHAVGRHKKHMRSAIDLALVQQPNRAKDVAYGNALLDELGRIQVDVESIQAAAENAGELRTMLIACKQRAELLELRGKFSGAIQTGSQSLTIVQPVISNEQALRMAKDFLRFFGDDTASQDGQQALPEPPGGVPEQPNRQGVQQ